MRQNKRDKEARILFSKINFRATYLSISGDLTKIMGDITPVSGGIILREMTFRLLDRKPFSQLALTETYGKYL